MWFRFEKLMSSDVTFTRAVRRLVIGDQATWRLTRDHLTNTREYFPDVESDGRVALGRVQWSSDNQQWHDINVSESIACDWPGSVSLIRERLTGVSSILPAERLLPRLRVTAFQISPGQLLLDLGLSNTNRIQTLLDQELATLPDGKVPLFLQEGHSDFESLAWLQLMLTEQVARNAQPDFSNSLTQASIVMPG